MSISQLKKKPHHLKNDHKDTEKEKNWQQHYGF